MTKTLRKKYGPELSGRLGRVSILLLIDTLAIYSSLYLSHIIGGSHVGDFIWESSLFIELALPLLICAIPLMAYQGLYTRRLPFWEEIRRIIKITILIIAFMILIVLARKDPSQTVPFVSFFVFGIAVIVFLSIFRILGKNVMYRLGIGLEKAIILGAGNTGRAVLKGLEVEKYMGYDVIGFLDDRDDLKGRCVQDKRVFGSTKHLPKFLGTLGVKTVVIAMPHLSVERLSQITNTVQKYTRRILLIPNLKGISLLNTELLHLSVEQLFLLEINNNLKSSLNKILKDIFDFSLCIIFLPLIVLAIGTIGVLIRVDSSGPIFYGHERVGRNGKRIKVYKLRSMYVDSEERLDNILESSSEAREEWNRCFKLKDDPRTTKVGKFLRKSSLDELPQILNVLKGEMSLVGPRPVLQEEIETYYREYDEYYYMVKPGITGLWQVSGRNDTGYDLRVKLDSWYVLNWSLWLDIVILFKTVRVVLGGEGAY